MNILITTLSLGQNYTRDYTLRMIEDVLTMSDIDFYITTDCKDIITNKYGENDRIKIQEINKQNIRVRLPIGKNKAANDFNFNMRYMCLEHVKDVENSVVIFTDCDNSFDWWDTNQVEDFIIKMESNGYDFFGPRTSYKLKYALSKFEKDCLPMLGIQEPNYDACTIFWHKILNFDMVDFESKQVKSNGWDDAGMPAEYLLIFNNKQKKLNKMVHQWKYFHDYLINRDYTYGTWAEGFEIGISSYVAGFKDYDITFTHPLWNKIFTPNGYKTGPRGGIVHGTEI